MMSQDCHHTIDCPIYAHYLECTKDTKTDVIICVGDKEGKPVYDCLALLIAFTNPKRVVPIGDELKDELSDFDLTRELPCPLNSLNNPDYLENKVNDLLELLKK